MIRKIFREWKTWRIVRKVAKENIADLKKIGFDVDWIGRIYTVVNIPDELMNMPLRNRDDVEKQQMAVDMYIKDNMIEITELLNKLMLADLVIYPSHYERFEGTNSMLVILAPERRYTKPWKIVLLSLLTCGVVTGLVFLVKYLIKIL
jgi:hypothetical protein